MFKLPAKMAGLKTSTIALAMVLLTTLLGNMAAATYLHVVGDDKGWGTSSDLAAWTSGRIFKVGDNIWFDNTASEESLVELESIDEFSSCDLTNPIKMYTEEINKVRLDGEGSRYFVSGNPESCKQGLKLHIKVHPKKEETNGGDGSLSEYKDVTNPHGKYDPDVPEPPPSPKPKPKPPHEAPPPEEFDPDVGPHSPPEPYYPEPPPSPKPKPKPPHKAPPPEEFDPDVGPHSPPEPYYPPPTPSGSTLLNGHFFAMMAVLWVAI